MDLKTIVLKTPMDVTVVTPDAGLPELKAFLDSAKTIGLDTETNWCGDFFFRKVRTIQVGDKSKQFVIDLLAFAGTLGLLVHVQRHVVRRPLIMGRAGGNFPPRTGASVWKWETERGGVPSGPPLACAKVRLM
jgi:hypothetical protein